MKEYNRLKPLLLILIHLILVIIQDANGDFFALKLKKYLAAALLIKALKRPSIIPVPIPIPIPVSHKQTVKYASLPEKHYETEHYGDFGGYGSKLGGDEFDLHSSGSKNIKFFNNYPYFDEFVKLQMPFKHKVNNWQYQVSPLHQSSQHVYRKYPPQLYKSYNSYRKKGKKSKYRNRVKEVYPPMYYRNCYRTCKEFRKPVMQHSEERLH